MIKILILSDLHLGEVSSRLSQKSFADFKVKNPKFTYQSYVNKILLNPIKKAIGFKEGNRKKIEYLVIAGDFLDFALQSYVTAFDETSKFLKVIAKANLFEEIIFIPGNHDHNIWTMLHKQIHIIRRIELGKPPKDACITQFGSIDLASSRSLFLNKVSLNKNVEQSKYGDTFLKGLFGNRKNKMPINVVYPNLYVNNCEHHSRHIMITHGHFFCFPWVMTSELFPENLGFSAGFTLENLELVNSPLTEFGWNSLGQAGKLTVVLKKIYEELKQGKTNQIMKVLQELGDYLDENIWDYKKYNPKEFLTDKFIDFGKNWIKTKLQKGIDSHRNDTNFLNKKDNIKRINNYIAASSLQYSNFMKLNHVEIPKHLIFGHTHVPISSEHRKLLKIFQNNKQNNVYMYNPGAWLKDSTPLAITIDVEGNINDIDLDF